eukprot:jgi/Chlat1/4843/Chrsp31S08937
MDATDGSMDATDGSEAAPEGVGLQPEVEAGQQVEPSAGGVAEAEPEAPPEPVEPAELDLSAKANGNAAQLTDGLDEDFLAIVKREAVTPSVADRVVELTSTDDADGTHPQAEPAATVDENVIDQEAQQVKEEPAAGTSPSTSPHQEEALAAVANGHAHSTTGQEQQSFLEEWELMTIPESWHRRVCLRLSGLKGNWSEEDIAALFTELGAEAVSVDFESGKDVCAVHLAQRAPTAAVSVENVNHLKSALRERAEKAAASDKIKALEIQLHALDSFLFVSNLATDVDDSQLRGIFTKYGAIERAFVVANPREQSKGYGFVEFRLRTQAVAAKNDTQLTQSKEHAMRVDWYDGKTVESYFSTVLFVDRLPRQPKSGIEKTLEDIFKAHGSLVNPVSIPVNENGQPRGFAFVEYKHSADADKAFRARNMMDGVQLHLSFANPARRTRAKLGEIRPTYPSFKEGFGRRASPDAMLRGGPIRHAPPQTRVGPGGLLMGPRPDARFPGPYVRPSFTGRPMGNPMGRGMPGQMPLGPRRPPPPAERKRNSSCGKQMRDAQLKHKLTCSLDKQLRPSAHDKTWKRGHERPKLWRCKHKLVLALKLRQLTSNRHA